MRKILYSFLIISLCFGAYFLYSTNEWIKLIDIVKTADELKIFNIHTPKQSQIYATKNTNDIAEFASIMKVKKTVSVKKTTPQQQLEIRLYKHGQEIVKIYPRSFDRIRATRCKTTAILKNPDNFNQWLKFHNCPKQHDVKNKK